MPWAGWCSQCGQYVWLDGRGGCVNGHGPEAMSNVYQTAPAAVTSAAPTTQVPEATVEPTPIPQAAPQPTAPQAAPQPTPQFAPATVAPFGSKEAVLQTVEAAVAAEQALAARRSQETDLEIVAAVGGQGSWDAKRVTYKALMKADEQSRTVIFWERTTESGSSIGGGFEKTSQFGGKSWGKTMGGSWSPGKGATVDYSWDYGRTRTLVQGAVESQGWAFKTVIMKGKALYK